MQQFKALYLSDLSRLEWNDIYAKKFSYYHRKAQTCKNRYLSIYYRIIFKLIKKYNLIDISFNSSIGKGLKLVHPYCITINSKAIIGDNVNI